MRTRCPWCWRMIYLGKRVGFAIHKSNETGVLCYGSGRNP